GCETKRGAEANSAMQKAAREQGYTCKHGSCMKQQHGACGGEPARIAAVRGGGGQRDAGGAHQTGKPDQQAQRRHHLVRSSSNFAIAARSSAIPDPERDEVVSTSGNAAGCLASATPVSAIRSASSVA